jgi:hypothetical protein
MLDVARADCSQRFAPSGCVAGRQHRWPNIENNMFFEALSAPLENSANTGCQAIRSVNRPHLAPLIYQPGNLPSTRATR